MFTKITIIILYSILAFFSISAQAASSASCWPIHYTYFCEYHPSNPHFWITEDYYRRWRPPVGGTCVPSENAHLYNNFAGPTLLEDCQARGGAQVNISGSGGGGKKKASIAR